jgi:hypothetical protein
MLCYFTHDYPLDISLDKMHRAMIPFGNSGTELSNKDTGRGATVKTRRAKASVACGKEASKKKENSSESRLVSEARPLGPSSSRH